MVLMPYSRSEKIYINYLQQFINSSVTNYRILVMKRIYLQLTNRALEYVVSLIGYLPIYVLEGWYRMVTENQVSILSLQHVLLDEITAEPAIVVLLVISYWNPHHTQSTYSTIILLVFFIKQRLHRFCVSILTLLLMIICKRMICSSARCCIQNRNK
jgi:hypothetical protein